MGIRTGKVQILVTVSLVLAGLVSFKAGGAFSMDHARKRLSVVRAYEREVEKHHDIPRPKLEVCQVMFERPRHDQAAQFSFADADFSRKTYDEMKEIGYKDMQRAIQHPYRVPRVGGRHAFLYRHGTHGKHLETDWVKILLSMWRRKTPEMAALGSISKSRSPFFT